MTDSALPLAAPTRRSRVALYLDLIRFNRPAGWLVLLWPPLVALWVASDGFPGWHLLAVFVLGTILTRSAGCVINDIADRAFDRHVQRTRTRPLTTGELSVGEAALVGLALTALALALVLTTRREAVAWSALGVLVAVVYPYTKRFLPVPQAVLVVAFSFGVPIAFAAVTGDVPPLAWLLLAANMGMVLAYDTEYAMVDRDDDVTIGIKTSAITFGRWDVACVMGCYAACLLLTAGLLAPLALGWPFWLGWLLAAAQLPWHHALIRSRERAGCFTAFSRSHWLGACLFAGVALGFALG